MKHRHKLAQRQRQRPASPSRRADVNEDEQLHSSASKLNKLPCIPCARKADGPSFASTSSVVAGGEQNDMTTVGPPAVALHRLEAPMIRGENSLRQTGNARVLSAGYRTNCSAQRAPTRAVADRSLEDTTPAAQQLRQSRSVRPRCRTSPSHPSQTPFGDNSKEYAASRYRRKSYGGAGGGCACLPAEKRPKLSRFTKVPVPGNQEGGRIKRQPRRRYDDGGIADASPARAPALAFGDGPPAPPRLSSDGTIGAAPPRANDPGFVNRLNAS